MKTPSAVRPLLFLLLALIALAARAAAPAARPNILWVVAEDATYIYYGAYGDPLARTPAFDRIAKEGILYERAYSTSAVCAPTRASIITGMYAPSLGTQHMRSNVPLPSWLRYFPAYLRDAGYYTSNNAKTDYNAAILPGTWDQSGAQAHYKDRRSGQPFFAIFNFNESHESSIHKRFPLTTDPAKVKIPAYLPDTPEVRKDIAQYYDRVGVADTKIGEVVAQLEADGLADDTIIFYYSDHGGVLPRSKRFLYESGTHPSLAVKFGKNFQHLAPSQPGSRSTELVNFVDFAPTVLSLAGVKAPAHFQGRAIAGAARAPAPEFTYNFRDRMDERIDLCRAVTDGRYRYIRNYRPDLPTMQFVTYLWQSASMKDWDRLHKEGKLNPTQESFFQPHPAEQLFDLANDYDNIRNLAADPAHRATLERFRAANRAHLLRIRDAGFMPEALLRDLSSVKTAADISRDDTIYPLARILDTIDGLQLSATLDLSALKDALADPAPAIRFWAAHAALRAPKSIVADLAPLLRDSIGPVRAAAAYVTARHGGEATAWPVLAATLAKGQRAELRLETLNYLTLLPNRPDSFRPLYEATLKAESQGENYAARAAEHLLAK
ncbi:MAG: sulfatase-like hydrolase/transferase [Opitutaceae bacterium]